MLFTHVPKANAPCMCTYVDTTLHIENRLTVLQFWVSIWVTYMYVKANDSKSSMFYACTELLLYCVGYCMYNNTLTVDKGVDGHCLNTISIILLTLFGLSSGPTSEEHCTSILENFWNSFILEDNFHALPVITLVSLSLLSYMFLIIVLTNIRKIGLGSNANSILVFVKNSLICIPNQAYSQKE